MGFTSLRAVPSQCGCVLLNCLDFSASSHTLERHHQKDGLSCPGRELPASSVSAHLLETLGPSCSVQCNTTFHMPGHIRHGCFFCCEGLRDTLIQKYLRTKAPESWSSSWRWVWRTRIRTWSVLVSRARWILVVLSAWILESLLWSD